ncbi:MAG: threonine aldolase family protein [bacterium]|jgi:threonine aldolase
MYSFKNDYSEGAHPRILQLLAETNMEQMEGYGEDPYTARAAELLKRRIGREDVAVHFFSGGTQTNLTALSAFLRPHEAAVSADTGHINVHETGAIEATGHKVVTVAVSDGKLNPDHVRGVLAAHTDEHMVKPRLVYISNPTEVGSIYSKAELTRLNAFCRENNLLLYVDGARLGSALVSEENDLAFSDFGELTDAFYIGATKNGALLGEALIICNDALKEDFRFHIKQKGGLLAKGRLLSLQFLGLFEDNLYFDLARHANAMADHLHRGISRLGYSFLTHSPSNQIFPLLPDRIIDSLAKKYAFHVWAKADAGTSAIRLVTSWATREETVAAFLADLEGLSG